MIFKNILFDFDRVVVLSNECGWTRVVNKGAINGAAIFALDNNENLLLVKEKRLFLNSDGTHFEKETWNIPRGAGEENETPQKVAQRELSEETGIDLSIEDFQLMGYIYPDYAFIISRVPLFLVNNCPTNFNLFDNKEISNVQFFSMNQIQEMILNQEMQDSFTLSGISLYSAMKK